MLRIVCAGVAEMLGRKHQVDFKKSLIEAIDPMDINPEHAQAFLADHEGALLAAIEELGFVPVGCGCHGIQLHPRHVLPPVKPRGALVEQADEMSDSDDDATSSESTDRGGEAEEEEIVEAVTGMKRKRQVFEPEECAKLTSEHTPLFTKASRIIKWHVQYDTDYNELERESGAAQPPIPFRSFVRGTQTRWTSPDGSIASILCNQDSLLAKQQRGTYRGPPLFTPAECHQAQRWGGI
jgi:hypothetical protein